jgi:copper(I)-binding protein
MKLRLLFALVALSVAPLALAQVNVGDAWARATVPAQKTSGAFLRIQSAQPATLIGVESVAAHSVEIHQMRRDGDVMRMRQVKALALPAGTQVELKPDGYHLMLIGLKQPLSAGQHIPLRLTIQHADKKTEIVEVQAEVRALGAAAPTAHDMH